MSFPATRKVGLEDEGVAEGTEGLAGLEDVAMGLGLDDEATADLDVEEEVRGTVGLAATGREDDAAAGTGRACI